VGLTLLIFLTVTLGITAGYHILSEILFPEAARVRQRMSQEFGKEKALLAASPLFKNLQLAGKTDKAAAPPAQKQVSGLKRLLDQADLKLSVQQVINMALCLGIVLGGAGWWLGGTIFAVVGAVCGSATPFVVVRWKHRARQEQFLNQLPAAFELMSRVIRAGQSVYQALQAVCDAFEDPVSGEFARCQKQLNLGLSPDVVFREMAEHSGILEIRIFVMALLIQTQSGGSLAEVLERLAGLVRSRLKLKKQVRTLTAEGRLQGWTLVVLPFVVFGAIMAINRSYAEILLDHPELLAAAGGSMLLGLLWIRKIVNFEF
jgi:tight adherence protein B